jgi:hypothetical protein
MNTELNETREQNKLLAHEKWELGQEKTPVIWATEATSKITSSINVHSS